MAFFICQWSKSSTVLNVLLGGMRGCCYYFTCILLPSFYLHYIFSKLCRELLSLQYYIFTSIHIYSGLPLFPSVKVFNMWNTALGYTYPCKKSHAKCSLYCFSFRIWTTKVSAVIKNLNRMTCLFHSWAWPRCYTEILEEMYF